MKSVPLLLLPQGAVGTGFFLQHNDHKYLITNRHNVTQHQTAIESFGQINSAHRGNNYEQVAIINPDEITSRNRGNQNINEITSHDIDIGSAHITHDESWDLAVIRLSRYRPDSDGFYIFDSISSPSIGMEVAVNCHGPNGTGDISNNEYRVITGEVVEPIKQLNFGNERYCISNLSEKPQHGASGAPVHLDDEVVGTYSGQFSLQEYEHPSLTQNYFYGLFEGSSALDQLLN